MGFSVAAQQVGIMFIFMLLGLWAAKRRWVDERGVAGMTNVLINFVVPCLIVSAMHRPFSMSQLHDLGVAGVIDTISFPVTIGLAYVLFRNSSKPELTRTQRFGTIYSNSMFLGMPLVQALLGTDGVFFAVVYSVVFNVFVWSQGYAMFPHQDTSALRRIFSTPAIPAVVVGLVFFLTPVQMPNIVVQGLDYLGNMNAPLSMLIVGASLAQVRWQAALKNMGLWAVVLVRNVVIPALGILALWGTGLPNVCRMAILITWACPTAAFLVVFSVKSGVDTAEPSSLVAVSTLASVITVPAMVAAATVIWQ